MPGGSGSCPGNCGRRTHKPDGCTGRDRAASGPAIPAGTRPAASSRDHGGVSNGNITAWANHRGASIGCSATRTNHGAAAGDDGTPPSDCGSAATDNGAYFDAIAGRSMVRFYAESSRGGDIHGRRRRHRQREAKGCDKGCDEKDRGLSRWVHGYPSHRDAFSRGKMRQSCCPFRHAFSCAQLLAARSPIPGLRRLFSLRFRS
jgi:hypothetical protein